jgi:hypothetical protein
MKTWLVLLLLSLIATGCVSKSKGKLREQNAFLAGQNAALMQRLADKDAQTPGVNIVGPVQHSHVPWVVGLTLAQAIVTAEYIGQDQPTQIIVTRNGESATLDASALLNGKNVPLEVGDTIELR